MIPTGLITRGITVPVSREKPVVIRVLVSETSCSAWMAPKYKIKVASGYDQDLAIKNKERR